MMEFWVMATTSNQQKKDYAKLLFTTTDLNQKEIALRVEVTEKTLGKWVNDGLWHSLRKSLLTSKGDQLRRLYEILEAVTTTIGETEGGFGDSKMADMMIKYTAAIKNLETETSAGQMFDLGIQFIRFVDKQDHDAAVTLTNYFDAFIQSELNRKF